MAVFLHSPIWQSRRKQWSGISLQSMKSLRYLHTNHDENSVMHNILLTEQSARRKNEAKSGAFTYIGNSLTGGSMLYLNTPYKKIQTCLLLSSASVCVPCQLASIAAHILLPVHKIISKHGNKQSSRL